MNFPTRKAGLLHSWRCDLCRMAVLYFKVAYCHFQEKTYYVLISKSKYHIILCTNSSEYHMTTNVRLQINLRKTATQKKTYKDLH